MMKVGVIDYGAGNLLSVCNALEFLKTGFDIIQNDKGLKKENYSKIILPGVGAFGDCIAQLHSRGLYDFINKWINLDKPFLGICVGYQILFEESEESEDSEKETTFSESQNQLNSELKTKNIIQKKGFNFLSGKVKKFDNSKKKVPQIGWNSLDIINVKDKIFNKIPQNPYFYFIHSYYTDLKDKKFALCTTEYDIKYVSASRKGNVIGTQFHIEKSQKNGLRFLYNFLNQ